MYKNKNSYKNKNVIIVPKNAEKHNFKSEIKPKVNNNNYENIRKIVENKEEEVISNSNVKVNKNKFNIV